MTNIGSNILKINKYFNINVKTNTLSIYRIIFGICMFFQSQTIYSIFLSVDKNNEFRFPFDFFEFIQPANSLAVYSILLFILKTAACAIVIGYRTKLFSFVYLTIYIYNFLLDMSYYNNHYYLIILILFLFSFIQTSNSFTLEHLIKKENNIASQRKIDISIFRFLIILPYFMGGIAKITSLDWLSGSVIASNLSEYSTFFHYIGITNKNFIIYFTTYFGLIFDLCIGFFLLHKRYWYIGILLTIPFHLANAVNLNIGIFPYLMFSSNILFVKLKSIEVNEVNNVPQKNNLKISFFYFFILFHILFPLRFLLMSENANWTGEGVTFSWRMKLNHTETEFVNFKLINKKNNSIIANLDSIKINDTQLKHLCTKPNDVLKFRDNLFRKYNLTKDSSKYSLTIFVKNRLNNSSSYWLYDTTVNFTNQNHLYFEREQFITKFKR